MPNFESPPIRQNDDFEQSAHDFSAASWTASVAVTTWTRKSESSQYSSLGVDKAAELLRRHFDRTEILSLRLAHHMAHSNNVQDRRDIASNPHCPKSVLAALSRDHDEKVQALVAGNINTSRETLKSMAESKSDLVQTAIVRNSSTPNNVLAKLGKHNRYAEIALNMRRKHIQEMIIDESEPQLSEN
jgi:hypothetical protein